MERTPIVSSNLMSVGFDRESGELEIEFKGGAVYRYYSVPEHIFDGLMGAASAGAYHHANIKSIYSFVKL